MQILNHNKTNKRNTPAILASSEHDPAAFVWIKIKNPFKH